MPAESVIFRNRARWLAAGLTALLLPKCLLCIAGYIALAGGFATAGPELCGGSVAPRAREVLAVAAPALVAGAWLLVYVGRRLSSTRATAIAVPAHRP